MRALQLGDRVRISKIGALRYITGYTEGKIYKVQEHEYDGLCVYNNSTHGWVHSGMGMSTCFDLVPAIKMIGGKLI